MHVRVVHSRDGGVLGGVAFDTTGSSSLDTAYPLQRSTGRRGSFRPRSGSVRERSQSKKTEPREERTSRT